MSVEIQLTKGYVAIVDDEDADLTDKRWTAKKDKSGLVYAARSYGSRNNKMYEQMHRIILSRRIGRDLLRSEIVDHVDNDSLNNTRTNLRIATPTKNMQNSRLSKRNKSGYKGVVERRGKRPWEATITVNGKRFVLGRFYTAETAAVAYATAAHEHFGEFANTPNVEPAPVTPKRYGTEAEQVAWMALVLGLPQPSAVSK